VQKGELLFSLNDIDARLALSQAKLSLADATTRIAEEKVRYKQANRDIAAVSRPSLASDFAKRIPQLAAANADYNAKKIALEKARIDLENTNVSAPFNGVILASNVNKAEFINTDTSLFTLADNSVLEIQLPITFDQWRLIDPDNIIHQPVELHIKELNDQHLTGQVSSLVPEVDSTTGNLVLIVQVNNKHNNIPFGTYAKATFLGKALQHVIWLPQSALINDHQIWGVSDNNTLGRVAIEILQYHEDRVLVRYQKPSFALRYFVEKSQFSFINQQVVTLNKS
jgi:RND family efflux transporter MFP subunit